MTSQASNERVACLLACMILCDRAKRDGRCTSGSSHCRAEVAESLQRSVAVIDPTGGWLVRWTQGMQACGVTHLRSPAFVHPAATDKEALLAYAAATGRQDELVEARALWGGSRKLVHRFFFVPGAIEGAVKIASTQCHRDALRVSPRLACLTAQ